ncbi:S1/P1 nuclease [Paucibacter sp. O1-1]|nr:S1/P1 nuclease [Paucibacter sp. O1-1]MDA3831194.1 S1/P1 nuclease [Paucibacter sp. O1-1]
MDSQAIGTPGFSLRGAAALLSLFAAVVLPVQDASAWGAIGHRVVGQVADRHLSPSAFLRVRQIMKNGSLGSVANWMDQVRGTPAGQGMDPWHYESLAACDGTRNCGGDACAGPQIRSAITTLKSGHGDQRRALRILVHLIGDVHQPLHTAENRDRGGNYVVILNRYCPVSGTESKPCKLHSYWDTKLVKDVLGQRTEQALVDALIQLPVSAGGEVDDWIRESNQLAKDKVHQYTGFACNVGPNRVKVSKAYDTAGAQLVAQQLALAGKRLADVLNEVYKP